MRLLVSVSSAVEAAAALAGGTDIVDAKDPGAGALGAVSLETLGRIRAVVGTRRPVSAAVGDAAEEASIERTAFQFATAGVAFVKMGFGGIASLSRSRALTFAAERGVSAAGGASAVVLVAYADSDRADSIEAAAVVDLAAAAGARGVLLDTADKNGPGLRALMDARALTAWVAHARSCGLLVALAGRLIIGDLSFVRDAGADIAGVRGAACDGGRTGRVSVDRVRRLRAACETPSTAVSGATV